MYKLKVVLLGPKESGKSTIANFISDATESSQGKYQPTKVVRILEFECPKLQILNNNNTYSGRYVKADIELWDISGNMQYEASWPALALDANGAVLVYNPDKATSQMKDIDSFYGHFCANMSDSQCATLAYRRNSDNSSQGNKIYRFPNHLSRLVQINANIDEEGNRFRTDFNNYLSGLLSNISDKREQEEISIMNMKSS